MSRGYIYMYMCVLERKLNYVRMHENIIVAVFVIYMTCIYQQCSSIIMLETHAMYYLFILMYNTSAHLPCIWPVVIGFELRENPPF